MLLMIIDMNTIFQKRSIANVIIEERPASEVKGWQCSYCTKRISSNHTTAVANHWQQLLFLDQLALKANQCKC